MIRFPLLSAILAVILMSVSFADELAPDDTHAACAVPPSYVPADLIDRPVLLTTGIGNSHETVTTTSPEAQRFYDQGLNYLESYVWIESARSFRHALRLDPELALAYVGLSRVYSGLEAPAAARQYLENAKTLASKVSERERRRIEIREKQLAAIDKLDDAALFAAYRKAIDAALVADLQDPQLWLLRGTAEEATAAGRGQRGTVGAVAFYDAVLRIAPDHASAHHYLVHTYETIGQIDKALEHGENYARLAPAIPHAAHMWGHDLRRVGRVDDAIEQFKKTDALERAYYAREKMEPGLDWHHGHNLDLLATCYQHKGQMKLAERTLRESAALNAPDSYRSFNKRTLPGFLIHRGRYAEALDAARVMTDSAYPQSRTAGHALMGQALIGLGRIDDAQAELAAARRDLEAVARVTPGIVPNRTMVESLVEALRGELLLRSGKAEEGRTVLMEAQRALRAVPGPDAWTQALFRLESMARSAREAGDWQLAEYTARQMLDHDPAYGGSHYALALVLRNAGDAAGAASELATARNAWRDADSDLPEMREIVAAVDR